MSLNVVVKVTKDCNLACRYPCYYYHLVKRDESVLDLSILKTLFDQVAGMPEVQKFNTVWHGGEPLLAGIHWFEKAIEIQHRSFSGSHVSVENSIQTNGTLVDIGWAEFFAQNNFQVGVSIDGPWNDTFRRTRDNKDSLPSVLEGLSILQNHGSGSGGLAVVTRASLGNASKLLDFMLSHGINSFDILPNSELDRSGNPLSNSITGDEYADFVIELYEAWLELDRDDVKIRVIEQMIGALLGCNPDLCMFCGSCDGVLCLDVNGDIYPCDEYVGDSKYILGNLKKETVADIVDGERYKEHVSLTAQLSETCMRCGFRQSCGGNCSKFRLKSADKNTCFGRKKIFSYMKNKLKKQGYV